MVMENLELEYRKKSKLLAVLGIVKQTKIQRKEQKQSFFKFKNFLSS